MSAKRSGERMARLRGRLFAGMAARGVPADVAEQVFTALAAFANFGFPESHSVAFAHLVYSTAWFKVHFPAAFTTGLLNAQPMGFWSPQSLVADAKRHGVVVHRPDVNDGEAAASLEGDRDRPDIRLGLSSVRGIGAGRRGADRHRGAVVGHGGPGAAGRCHPGATGGAGHGRGPGRAAAERGRPRRAGRRRSLLWSAGAAAQATPGRLPGVVTGAEPPALPARPPLGGRRRRPVVARDGPRHHGHGTGPPPAAARGVLTAAALDTATAGGRVTVGGVVTHRQQPESAHGAVFINLEDETGMVNVICSRGAWVRWKPVARGAAALLVRGRLERVQGVVNLVAERIDPLDLGPVPRSRDFR